MSHPNNVLLEVAITSVDDALTAQRAGADRLELNSALGLGGLTPSLGTLIEVKANVQLPVMVMVRPRPGGFHYSSADFAVMQRDVELLLEYGADGIVFGILHETGELDSDRCRLIVEQAGGSEVILHRAFDVVPDPFVALEHAIDLGFQRIMTSGQEATAYNGVVLISELLQLAGDRIEILPAGGINRFTVADVLSRTGCSQIHASLRGRREDRSVRARPEISFGGAVRLPEDRYDRTSLEAVTALKKATQ
ncbi:MAG: copper homeostasis protein CutC [Gemmataceae bacterium]